MIFSESNFYISLKKVLLHLNRSSQNKIKIEKYALTKTVKTSLKEQFLFQGVITFSLIIAAPDIKILFLSADVSVLTLRITLIALLFNLSLLTSVTFLFYLERYKGAFISVLIFFSVNVGVTIYNAVTDFPYYGIGYLTGSVLGTVAAVMFLFNSIKYLDRNIFFKF